MDTLNGISTKHMQVRILEKSSYYEIIGKFGVPKSDITVSLNVIFPTLKYSSLKHLWDIVGVGKITKRIVREVIAKIVVRKISGNKNYLLKDE